MRRLTARTTTLDYSILWNSLHGALIYISMEARHGVVRADVMRNAHSVKDTTKKGWRINMSNQILLRIAAGLFVLWGILNLVGGALGSIDHPSVVVLPLFITVGILITAAGIGFWIRKDWATLIAIIGLVGLSITALYSASVLRGWSDISIYHHVTRLIISGIIFFLALLAKKRAASHQP